MEKNKEGVKVFSKIGKAVLLILIVFIVLYIINMVRNVIILSDILEKESIILSSNNIYYETTSDTGMESKFYKKDEIEMFDTKVNENRIIKWRNINTNEGIIISPNSKVAYNVKADEIVGFNIPLLVHSINEIGEYKIYATLSSIIYTDKNCYVIMMGCNNKTWVNKETGEVLKRQDGIIKSENNKANPAMIYYNNWKINELTEEDMAKPDISSFEIRQ